MARAAVASAVVLLAATSVYYAADSALVRQPVDFLQFEVGFWWLVSVVLGCPLGLVGALCRRRGVVGLLAGMVVPVGAAAQQLLWGSDLAAQVLRPGALGARVVVWVVVAALGSTVVVRFVRQRAARSHRGRPPRAVRGRP